MSLSLAKKMENPRQRVNMRLIWLTSHLSLQKVDVPIYVNKYAITTQDESRKPLRSSDVAKSDVEIMVVSSKEKKKPSKTLLNRK